MKKLVFASVVALASVGFVASPSLRAQDPGQISIADPAEYNAFQMFQTQTDPKAKAAAGESFLEKYPQSKAKSIVLDSLLDAYQATGDAAKVLDTANKLLQIDPNNLKAILYSVLVKKQQCAEGQRERSGAVRRFRRPGQERPSGSQARRNGRRRMEETDRRSLSDLPLGHRPGRCSLQEGFQRRAG